MRAYPRSQIVSADEVGVYHCVARCVRRAFLCELDVESLHDYEHRKEWIRERLEELAAVFAIDICGYAVKSNHIHLVLRVRPDLAREWSFPESHTPIRSVFTLEAKTEQDRRRVQVRSGLMHAGSSLRQRREPA
jgi:hypothetical protein